MEGETAAAVETQVIEIIERDGVRYAEIIRANARFDKSAYVSPNESSLQFGVIRHPPGYHEAVHTHRPPERKISDTLQVLMVRRGRAAIDFFEPGTKVRFHSVELGAGDSIMLIHGAHNLRVLEDFDCITVKQGPFRGDDKVAL